MLDHYLQILLSRSSLSKQQAQDATCDMLEAADPHQIAAFLALLKYRGETPEEIAGMATALHAKSLQVSLPFPVLDIVGTGGDGAHTVNISTGAAILAAACGIPIAKHGNRSVSSKSGSADVLEALGIRTEMSPEMLTRCIQEVGIGFLFAPYYHPALKAISPVRKGLKLPTVFNLLGPLLNPARTEYALIGVPNEKILERISEAVLLLDQFQRVLVFHGAGLDELTPLGKISAREIANGKICVFEFDPQELGFASCKLSDLQGGYALENAAILKRVLSGEPGAVADSLIFTAGCALWIFGKTAHMQEGIQIARNVLREGKALELLNKWKTFGECHETA